MATKNDNTKKDTRPNTKGTSAHVKRTPIKPKIRGYDKLAPFLHEVNKIVAEDCAKQANLDDLPWYSIWEE